LVGKALSLIGPDLPLDRESGTGFGVDDLGREQIYKLTGSCIQLSDRPSVLDRGAYPLTVSHGVVAFVPDRRADCFVNVSARGPPEPLAWLLSSSGLVELRPPWERCYSNLRCW
jgi:hypothetical protein